MKTDRSKEPMSRLNEHPSTEVRITYRTIRVLSAISDTPGASNRAIGDLAEIADVGQISRMLWRLQGFGLISNARSSGTPARTNAWELTEAGDQLLRAVHAEEAHGRGTTNVR